MKSAFLPAFLKIEEMMIPMRGSLASLIFLGWAVSYEKCLSNFVRSCILIAHSEADHAVWY